MRRNIKVILIILTIIALILPITYSYAIEKIGGNINEKSFFEVSSLEVAKNEKIEMTINLNEIEYNKFIFELESSQNLEDIEVSKELVDNSKDLELEKSSNEISIEIDKETTNLSTITLYYQIPEQLEVNDTIRVIATVTNLESDKKEEKEETEDESVENDKEESKLETKSLKVEVKIVEKKEEQNTNQAENQDKQNVNNKNENKENEEKKSQVSESNQKNINEKLLAQSNTNNSSTQFTSKSVSTISSQKTGATVTYNGSDNNYLSELSVGGYTLNKEFSKDNSTYFVTVENDVDSLDIVANQDEDSAIVCIYGNENLSKGINKILISVTAENGNVRNYRIYVTKN